MDREEIELELDRLDSKMVKLSLAGKKDSKEYLEVKNEFDLLKDKLDVLSSDLIISDDGLDIYEQNDMMNRKIYLVTNMCEKEIIGRIYINYLRPDPVYGNIGYEVKETYRGKNITVRSLKLLKKTIIAHGLTEPIISVKTDNKASISVIKKLNGEISTNNKLDDGINRYVVKL